MIDLPWPGAPVDLCLSTVTADGERAVRYVEPVLRYWAF